MARNEMRRVFAAAVVAATLAGAGATASSQATAGSQVEGQVTSTELEHSLSTLQHLKLENSNTTSYELKSIEPGNVEQNRAVKEDIASQVKTLETVNFRSASEVAITRFKKAGLNEEGAEQIQSAVDKATATGSDQDRAILADLITSTSRAKHLTCLVSIATKNPGATVRYQTYAEHRDGGLVHTLGQPTNIKDQSMDLGYYYFWTERSGKVTSDQALWFSVIGESDPIQLEELP